MTSAKPIITVLICMAFLCLPSMQALSNGHPPVFPETVFIHFGEMDSSVCVDGTEWDSLGLTIHTDDDLLIWMANPGTECPPSRQCLTTASNCTTATDDIHDDFILVFDPPVAWVSFSLWDNDVNPGDEYVSFILEDGDSIAVLMKTGPGGCVTHSSDEVLSRPAHSPIVRVRIDESGTDVDGMSIDNIEFTPSDPNMVFIHFDDVDSCDCVTGTEWESLGLTITSPYEMMCAVRSPGLFCPPSKQAVTTAHDCSACSRNDDTDLVLTFSPPATWASVSLYDNDYTSSTEFIAFILSNGDSIAMPLRADVRTCETYASSDTLQQPHDPIVRIRIEEDEPGLEPGPEGVDLDNVAFIPGCPDTVLVPGSYATIATAMAAACSGTVILVDPGTYFEHGIAVKEDVKLVGRLGPDSTVIDAQSLGRALTCGAGDAATLIEGFTIKGGGIYCNGASPTIQSCIFAENSDTQGGGLNCYQASPIISNCEFTGNNSTGGGGAIALRWSNAVISDCAFAGNIAHGGGSIWMQSSYPSISFCVFKGDSASLGGAIQCDLSSGPTVSHCTFYGCKADQGGAGVHSRENSNPSLENCIVAFSPVGEGVHCDEVHPGSASLSCCDIYGNAGGDWVGCVAGQYGMDGNIGDDPRFCGTPEDLHLASDSPCLGGQCGQMGALGEACWGVRPKITEISDVGNDQGRSVRIKWARSVYDAVGDTVVTGYGIYRRQDAFLLGTSPSPTIGESDQAEHAMLSFAGWDYVATVPARGDSVYQCVAETLCDSTDQGICWSVFFVSAMTSDPSVYFDSDPDSGYSVDNLAPGVPQGIGGQELGDEVLVHWDPNPEEDLRYYKVYRGADADFDIEDALGIYELPDTSVTVDDIDPYEVYYYRVTAIDFSGNEGGPSDAIGLCAKASVTVDDRPVKFHLSEGKPNPFSGMTNIRFALPVAADVEIGVYDIGGRLVTTVLSEHLGSGYHHVTWQGLDTYGRRVHPGVYFIRMEAGHFTAMKKAILLR